MPGDGGTSYSGKQMETYTVNVECSNCQRDGQIQVAKGTLVPEVSVCPTCGCETAKPKCLKPYTIGWPSIPRKPIDWGNSWGNPQAYLSQSPLEYNHITNQYEIHQGNQQ